MNKIHITEAKKIAERVGAEAVVILAFNGDQYAATSYGETKAKCSIIGRWMDGVVDLMMKGALRPPTL